MRTSKLAAQKARLLLLQDEAPMELAHDLSPERADCGRLGDLRLDPRPEMVCFRGQTLAMVRHFFELSSQLGRLPSLLGREFFRARVSHHAIPSFEEHAVFLRDVELCIQKLTPEHQDIITLAGFYDFSHDEVAGMLSISKTAVQRCFAEALDALAEIFLEARLLCEQRPDRRQRQLHHRGVPVDVAGKRPPQNLQAGPPAEADCELASA